jgi:hypothetical protein
MLRTQPAGLPYSPLIAALSLGQIISWATVYYGFTSFVLPMMAETGWSKPLVMGANTLGLLVWGLYDLTRPDRRVKGDSKVVWALIIIFINVIGPILYLLVGHSSHLTQHCFTNHSHQLIAVVARFYGIHPTSGSMSMAC